MFQGLGFPAIGHAPATPRPRRAKSILAPTLPGPDASIRVPTLLTRVEREVVESWGRGSRSRPAFAAGRSAGRGVAAGLDLLPRQCQVASCSEDFMPLSTHVFCFLFRLPMYAKLV
jgi:hypothetical protein